MCHRDFAQAQELLRWVTELDPKLHQHKALIVASSQVPDVETKEALRLAKALFGKATAIKQRHVEEGGWPKAPNALFRLAAEHIRTAFKESFLWLEPDATPLASGWLTAIDREYHRAGRAFMGCVYPWMSATKKVSHLNGNAVYPPDIARYNPQMLRASTTPWDCTKPELTLKHTHATRLIQNDRADRATNQAFSFSLPEDLATLDKQALIFHACKDGSLIARLREQRHAVAIEKEHFMLALLKAGKRQIRAFLRGGSSYYHSGCLGDVVYALYAIKLHGGGDLFIGPKQNHTKPCREPIGHTQYNLLLPLLKRQRYLHRVAYREAHPNGEAHYDLNVFRNHFQNHSLRSEENIHNLCEAHCYAIGVRHLMKQDEPWLDVGDPIWTGKIIVHRSARYHAPQFPWHDLVKRHHSRMLFVGLEQEYREFERQFGCVSFYKVQDFEELAQVIAGGVCAVMNQSFPCSLALAMGQRVYQEMCPQNPDCCFERDSYMNQESGLDKLEQWLC